MNKIKIGKRIRINKSDRSQDQLLTVGERGTITNMNYDGYKLILEIAFDNGEKHWMDTTNFRFDIYDKV